MAAHPYWRLGIASGSLYVELKELAFLDAAGNDTSVGGTASASSEYSSSYSADKAFDKNLSTMWDINSGGFPAYIQYHTSTPVDVAFVKLTSSGAYSWSGLTLSYSDNGSTWSTPTTLNVVSGGPPSSGVETVLAAPVRRNPLVLVGSKVVELPAGDKINGVSADLADKENLIAAGTTAQYWRGDKTWRDFFTDVRAATLTGLSTATNAVIDAADTVLAALGKLQAQVSAKANATEVREKLTATRTYYVRTDGSDSNNGLANTSGGAFLTIQKAVDVASALDNGGYDVLIQLGDGTYSAGAVLKSFTGSGRSTIRGNATTPANTHISVASGSPVIASSVIGVYAIEYLKLTSAASGNLVQASGATTSIILKGNVYGSAGGGSVYAHVSAQNNASVDFGATNYEITGGAGYHIYAASGGIINCNVLTCTLTGAPAFAGAFAYASMTGITRAVSNTYTGSATGKRYDVLSNGIVQTGAGATVLPGDAAGTTATGGLYI